MVEISSMETDTFHFYIFSVITLKPLESSQNTTKDKQGRPDMAGD